MNKFEHNYDLYNIVRNKYQYINSKNVIIIPIYDILVPKYIYEYICNNNMFFLFKNFIIYLDEQINNVSKLNENKIDSAIDNINNRIEMQPIYVRYCNLYNKYIIMNGTNRYIASALFNFKYIPVICNYE